MYASIAREYARIEEEEYAKGCEYARAWMAGQINILSIADPIAVAIMPAVVLAYDSLDSKFEAGWTVEEIQGLARNGTRNMTVLGFMADPAAVLEGIRDGTVDIGAFVESIDIPAFYAHVQRYMNARISPTVPTVAEILESRNTPVWAIPMFAAVDSCARFPTMDSGTDPNNVSRRLLNMNANGTYWAGRPRDRMQDVFGYANVLSGTRRASRINPSAHTDTDESEGWPEKVRYNGRIEDWEEVQA